MITRDLIYLINTKTNAINIIDLNVSRDNIIGVASMLSRLHFVDSDHCMIRRYWNNRIIPRGIINDDNYLGYINIISIMRNYKEIYNSIIHDIALEITRNNKFYDYLKEKIHEAIPSSLPDEQYRILSHFGEICEVAKHYCTTMENILSSDIEKLNNEYPDVFKNNNS